MADSPEYIDLLNDIRLQEYRAGIFLKAWADKTEHPGLKGCLSVVAERETSHGDIFDRRIRELGGTPEDKDDDLFHERLRVAESDMSDAEKDCSDAGVPDAHDPAHRAHALRRGRPGRVR